MVEEIIPENQLIFWSPLQDNLPWDSSSQITEKAKVSSISVWIVMLFFAPFTDDCHPRMTSSEFLLNTCELICFVCFTFRGKKIRKFIYRFILDQISRLCFNEKPIRLFKDSSFSFALILKWFLREISDQII